MAPPRGDYDILQDEEKLRHFYWKLGMTTGEIADVEGCVSATVTKYLKEHGIETRRKGARVGEEHPKWVDRETKRYYGSWDRKRQEALERDSYCCQSCGVSDEAHYERFGFGLEVHHHQKLSEFDDATSANVLSNLVSLCRVWHKKYERGVCGPLSGIR